MSECVCVSVCVSVCVNVFYIENLIHIESRDVKWKNKMEGKATGYYLLPCGPPKSRLAAVSRDSIAQESANRRHSTAVLSCSV